MKHIRQRILKRKVLLLKLVIPTVSLAIISLGMVFSFHFLSFPTVGQLPSLTGDHRATIRVDLFAEGLSYPTSMAFVDNVTLLVLEKDIGSIRKISDGMLEKEPVLQLNVDSTAERGLLGIAVLREDKPERRDINAILGGDYGTSRTSLTLNTGSPSSSLSSTSSYCNCSIFIYFTQKSEDTKTTRIVIYGPSTNHNNNINSSSSNNSSLRNVIYKYDWDEKSLTNPHFLLDLPAEPGPYHNGGKLKIGPNNQLYAVIGDLTSPNSILQNHHQQITNSNNQTPVLISSSSVILRINPYDGLPSTDNPFMNHSENNPVIGTGGRGGLSIDYYYA